MRVALYARYSSDLQSAASIEDQFAACRRFVAAKGWTVAAEFSDAAISGASLFRPGIVALVAAVHAGRCDVVLAEALDRFSRSMKDTAALYEQMTFAGVTLATVADGPVNDLHVGLKGTMNALYLKDLADKTRRGMRGVVASGRIAGGRSYGYRVVPGDVRGRRIIDEEEAAIVRRVFTAYVEGQSPKAIAKALNRDGVPAPRQRAWSPSTINGHARRGTGLLNNELYIGRIVWSRQTFRKHPETGRRRSKALDSAQREVFTDPALRIVDDALWQAVKARQATLRHQVRPEQRRRPVYLFSGLTVCGVCAGGMIQQRHARLYCRNHVDRGTCANARSIPRVEVEARVLDALQTRMLDPDRYRAFCAGFAAKFETLRRDYQASLAGVRGELATVERRIHGLIEAIADGTRGDSITAMLAQLEARRAVLVDDARERDLPRLSPDLASLYRVRVAGLVSDVEQGSVSAREALRAFVARVVVPADPAAPLALVGHVAAMLNGGNGGIRPPQPSLSPSHSTHVIELPAELWTVAA